MFTGIIETLGHITHKRTSSQNIEITIEPENKDFLLDVKKGASIAVNGCCLTVTKLTQTDYTAFISSETFKKTNLTDITPIHSVNMEKALKLNDRLDGHIVMGHIDDTALVTKIFKKNQDFFLEVKLPTSLVKYTIQKGSIAINGISLTIAEKKGNLVSFSIIPETYENTNIPQLKTGQKVNIEMDMFAKYIENFK